MQREHCGEAASALADPAHTPSTRPVDEHTRITGMYFTFPRNATRGSRVGLSCDYANEYLTDAPDFRAVTQSIFVDLFRRGDIVEDLRPNIYDPVEGTTIADAEVQRISRETLLCDVRWTTDDGQDVIISTTRPELICACGVVVVHPDDDRYSHLVGKKISLPLPVKGREDTVEIMTHPSVKSDFGSGVLMVCSFGDQNDYAQNKNVKIIPPKKPNGTRWVQLATWGTSGVT